MKFDHQGFTSDRNRGWGRNFYRSRNNGKVAGVCAGLAENLNIEAWIVRLLFVGSLFMLGGLTLVLYIAAIFVLAKRPKQEQVDMVYDEEQHQYRPRNAFKYEASASQRLAKAKARVESALARVGRMETYVTSKQHELNKEFANLNK